MEKYLRKDFAGVGEKKTKDKDSKSSNARQNNKFIITKRSEDDLEYQYNQYSKYLKRSEEDEECNENNFIMKSEEELSQEEENKQETKDYIYIQNDPTVLKLKSTLKVLSEINGLETPCMSNPARGHTYTNSNEPNYVQSNIKIIPQFNPSSKTNSHILNSNNILTLSKEEEEDTREINKDFTTNYMNFESIYLNEGKIKNRVEDVNIFKSQEVAANNPNLNTYKNNFKNTINTLTTSNTMLTTLNSQNVNNEFKNFKNENVQLDEKHLTIIIPTITSNEIVSPNLITSSTPVEMSHQNEFKLRRLQEKMEEKIRQEYENKIRNKEAEIEHLAKQEFEEAMDILKNELEKNLDDEKRKMEEELQRKWNDKYEDLLVECKSKLRDDKEQKLATNMYHKMKPAVEKEIYKKEYHKVEEKIRKELEGKLNQDIQAKKIEEVEKVKRKLEYFTQVKLEEMETSVKTKCREEVESEIKKDFGRKEKEMKINYLRKFENFKNSLEKQLKDEYDVKKKELSKEISEMKSKIYRQKCSEKLKLNKISKIKKNLEQKEKVQLENAEKLEKVLHTAGRNLAKSTSNKENAKKKKKINDLVIEEEYYSSNSNLYLSDGLEKREDFQNQLVNNTYSALAKITEEGNKNLSEINPKFFSEPNTNPQSPSNKNNSVNLMELNNKLKNLIQVKDSNSLESSKQLINNNPHFKEAKERSLIMNERANSTNFQNLNSSNLKESLNNIIMKNSRLKIESDDTGKIIYATNMSNSLMSKSYGKENYKLDSPTKLNEKNEILKKLLEDKAKEQESTSEKPIKSNSNINTTNNKLITSQNIQFSNHNNFIQTNANNSQYYLPFNIQSYLSNPKIGIASCVSLRLNNNTPITLIDFGKYLVKYIENEENYRILFEKENKKLKNKIKKNFDDENVSDHCLLEYMLELWEKLEVSHCVRYQILNELSKSKPNDTYHFLDKETEYLTEYFQTSQEVYNFIKTREKLKTKLQGKANKYELTSDDKEKFKLFTKELEHKIKKFKQINNLNIVWKGLHYEWMINYENWFYENSSR